MFEDLQRAIFFCVGGQFKYMLTYDPSVAILQIHPRLIRTPTIESRHGGSSTRAGLAGPIRCSDEENQQAFNARSIGGIYKSGRLNAARLATGDVRSISLTSVCRPAS